MTLDDEKYIEILEFVLNGKPYREIAKLQSVSKNTVTDLIKRLRNTGSIFPSTSKKSIYDPVIKEIQDLIVHYLRLRRSTYNIHHKIKLTNHEIYLLILAKDYAISFTKVKELIKFGKNIIKESHLHIVHLPGEAVEFDWGTITIQIGDQKQPTKISLAVFSFPYSNYKKAYVLKNSSGESFVTAFQQFIREMNGVPSLFILDNMRIARKFTTQNDATIQLTPLFEDLCKHYQFKVKFCSPYCPNQKGNVENNVGILKKAFEQSYIHSFDTIGEIEEYLNQVINKLNGRKHPRKNDTCENLVHHEKNSLLDLPKTDYVYCHERKGKVSKQGMIRFEHNDYAVPEKFKGESILVRYNDKSIYFLMKDRKDVIAKYTRVKKKGKRKHRIWYMIHKLKNKSNGLLDSEEYQSMSKAEKLLLQKVFKYDCSEFLTFIELVKDQPRNTIRKFVHTFKHTLEDMTVDDLMNEILRV